MWVRTTVSLDDGSTVDVSGDVTAATGRYEVDLRHADRFLQSWEFSDAEAALVARYQTVVERFKSSPEGRQIIRELRSEGHA